MRKSFFYQVSGRRQDERGATLVIFAVLILVILGLAAILVDGGQAKASRRDAQSISDMAALGGGESLSNGSPLQACQDAVTYVNTNTPDLAPKITASSFCAQSGNNVALTSCSVTGGPTQAKPTTTVGRYTITVVYPALASDIADSNYSGGAGINDGSACQRMGVQVAIANPAIFGGVLGNSGIQTSRMAVVKAATSTQKEVPSLWLLDPFDCTSLAATGGSQITVGVTSPTLIPGLITIDSDGTDCTGGQTTISAGGTGTFIRAVPTSGSSAGKISLYAMPAGSTVCSTAVHSCDPANVSSGALSPQPKSSETRATRGPVDWKYNCKTGYPDYHTIDIVDCPDTATESPYIDNLSTAIGTSGQPSGFQRWTDSYNCNVPTGTTTVSGNWWINCNNFAIGNGTIVNISGNVVFEKDIAITGSGQLNLNTGNGATSLPSSCLPPLTTPCTTSSSSAAAFAYMRGGNLTSSGATNFNHVALIQKGGFVKMTGGSAPIWSAPTEGPFKALALWSDFASNQYQINGGASMALTGVFFTPEAVPFSISGGSPVAQQSAQFISRQLAISGGANLTMAPDEQNFVSIPPKAGILIR